MACTLGGDEQGERIQQWRQVLDSATGREDIDGGLRLRFPADPDLVADVARLAAAEQGCKGSWPAPQRAPRAGKSCTCPCHRR